jgi:hypothetical protein
MKTSIIVSILFILTGLIFVVISSNALSSGIILTALGILFVAIGLILAALYTAGLFIAKAAPSNKKVYEWWVQLIGGELGALSFALPSALIIPLVSLLPPDVQSQMKDQIRILTIFTFAGIAVLIAIIIVTFNLVKDRPRWKKK